MNLNGVATSLVGQISVNPTSNGTQASASDPVTAVPATDARADRAPDQESVSQEHAKNVVKRANDLLADTGADMRLEYKMENSQGSVSLVDTKTGMAIRQIPASSFIQIVHQQFVGLLMDARA